MTISKRDMLRVEYDAAPDGADLPDFQTLIDVLPCLLRDVAGDETYKGRQIVGHISTVVETSFQPSIKPNMRLVVVESINREVGELINITYVHHPIAIGRDRGTWLYCRETATDG